MNCFMKTVVGCKINNIKIFFNSEKIEKQPPVNWA